MKLVLLILCALLLGCEQPLSGTITDKRYHAPYTETRFHYVDAGDVQIPIPYSVNHPARWTITINGTISDGKTRRRVFEVGELTWNKFNIGDTYPPAESSP